MAEGTTSEPPISGVSISDSVVAKVARRAIAGIEGIHTLGGASARALAGLRGEKSTSGINIDLHEEGVDVDITMSIVYGAKVPEIAEACRKAVTEQIEQTTGLKVRAVNVNVNDIYFADDASEPAG